jgi:hypothetical protein
VDQKFKWFFLPGLKPPPHPPPPPPPRHCPAARVTESRRQSGRCSSMHPHGRTPQAITRFTFTGLQVPKGRPSGAEPQRGQGRAARSREKPNPVFQKATRCHPAECSHKMAPSARLLPHQLRCPLQAPALLPRPRSAACHRPAARAAAQKLKIDSTTRGRPTRQPDP